MERPFIDADEGTPKRQTLLHASNDSLINTTIHSEQFIHQDPVRGYVRCSVFGQMKVSSVGERRYQFYSEISVPLTKIECPC